MKIKTICVKTTFFEKNNKKSNKTLLENGFGFELKALHIVT